ncbi:MAG TPA: hypothetical protein VHE60_13575 [Pyrinomonadaceae bacterium]|nr:hypothetical protein [Pyrinomonadaceae bacterium]
MKRHPVRLATGLLLFAVLACNLGKNANNSNSNSNGNKSSNISTNARRANADVYVETANVAKDDNGDAGESTTTFAPSDRTVHCVVTLNKAKGNTKVKVVWVAVDTEGAKNEELDSLEYSTKLYGERVDGHLTWPRDWPRGMYRVEVYINGALDKTITYTVE